jgi:hypothetical protein
MEISVDRVYEAKNGLLVTVLAISDYGWVDYRKCDAFGVPLPGTRKATTRDTEFKRRFPLGPI